jgi:hypothetical protein
MTELFQKLYQKNIWDDQPIFCFTTDIDWASEDVMKKYFSIINELDIKPTLFVTHNSEIIQKNFEEGNIDRGIHPNFLTGSSHGNDFREVIETCIQYAPEAYGYRSHRAFDVTDTNHMLKNEYNYKYVSHQITILQPLIRPYLHESGLINYPVYFEDGTHLYNKLNLNFKEYQNLFEVPGIKIISFHPMNFVFNSPTMPFMRTIKDSLSRGDYNSINEDFIDEHRNKNIGIGDMILDIVEYVKSKNFPIFSMNELYHKTIK